MPNRVAAGHREHVRCVIGSLTLVAGGATCGLGYVFGVVVKFEGGTASGADSTLECGNTLGGGTTPGGGVALGGDGGDAVGLAPRGFSMVLVFQLLNRSRRLDMAERCLW